MIRIAVLALACALCAAPALAQRQGDVTIGAGFAPGTRHGPRDGASGGHSTLFLNLGGGALVRDTVEYAGASWTGGLGIVLAVSLMGDIVVNRLGEALREP